MKKIALLLTCALALSACKSTSPQTATTPETTGEQTSDLTSIAAMMAAGKPISCTMSKKDGTNSMAYMMKDKKIKVTGISGQGEAQSSSMITDGTYMYTWDDATKKGMKLALDGKDIASEARTQAAAPTLQSDEDKKKFEDQGYDVKCATATIDDTEFVPPTDVTFEDLSVMMEKSQQMMAKPDAFTEDQVKEMMKQYQQ